MAGLALPKLRWLLAGALAAGMWAVSQDKNVPRPPARVPVSESVLNLPKTVDQPPRRPRKMVTGSIVKPARPRLLQTTSNVHLRAKAGIDSAIVTTLEAGQTVREMARSGDWRMVLLDKHQGWVHGDYLRPPMILTQRPKLPVPGVTTKAVKAASNDRP